MRKFNLFLVVLVAVSTACLGQANKVVKDYLLLNSGEIVEGEIVKFGPESFTVLNEKGHVAEIQNEDVHVIAVEDELTTIERYNLGILDGKRYAKNKGGNLALGAFTGLIGTAFVYLSPDQTPSIKAMNGPNKVIVNDAYYMRGYAKGAKSKSVGNALIGALAWIGLLLVAL